MPDKVFNEMAYILEQYAYDNGVTPQWLRGMLGFFQEREVAEIAELNSRLRGGTCVNCGGHKWHTDDCKLFRIRAPLLLSDDGWMNGAWPKQVSGITSADARECMTLQASAKMAADITTPPWLLADRKEELERGTKG